MNYLEITRETGIPLLGAIPYGIIDRGTNLLQVRAFSGCNLNCNFCSVDSGPKSKTRTYIYGVEPNYLFDWLEKVIEFKGRDDIEIHLDGTGEPMMYPHFLEFLEKIRKIPQVKTISLQTNGTLLTKEKIKKMETLGLNRINLSISAMEPELAKKISGCDWYDIEHVKEMARIIVESKIDLLIAPVFMKNINNEEIPKIIEFALNVGAGKKWPALGIQKYEKYRLGRIPKKVEIQSWWRFYNRAIKKWENKFDLTLRLSKEDFGIKKCKSPPKEFSRNEIAHVKITAPGWLEGEGIAVARNRSVLVLDSDRIGTTEKVKIISNKHGVYVAKKV